MKTIITSIICAIIVGAIVSVVIIRDFNLSLTNYSIIQTAAETCQDYGATYSIEIAKAPTKEGLLGVIACITPSATSTEALPTK